MVLCTTGISRQNDSSRQINGAELDQNDDVRIEASQSIIEKYGFDSLYPKVKETLENYFVSEVANPNEPTEKEKKLYVKKEGSEESWEVVPLENTFEIVMKAHLLTEHGGVDAMAEWLSRSHSVLASVTKGVKSDQVRQRSKIKK